MVISLEVKDEGSAVVKEFSDKTVSKVKQMSDKSIGHVQRLASVFSNELGGAARALEKSLNVAQGSYIRGTNYVPKTGLYELHRGEKATPVHKAGNQAFGDIIISIPESAAPQRPEDWREITRTYIKPELERLGQI